MTLPTTILDIQPEDSYRFRCVGAFECKFMYWHFVSLSLECLDIENFDGQITVTVDPEDKGWQLLCRWSDSTDPKDVVAALPDCNYRLDFSKNASLIGGKVLA